MEENKLVTVVDDLLQERRLAGNSIKWANWMSELSLHTCQKCIDNHGKIVEASSVLLLRTEVAVNIHTNCRCKWVRMRTKQAGKATSAGKDGADFSLFYNRILPDCYITKKQAVEQGWISKKRNLAKVCPNKMIGGDLYNNDEYKLPSVSGRVWYEADINYNGGFRNRQRIIYSNDGLIFVTYDHYQTFYEITA
ncbi:MAG: phage head morphogenesis protein [Clostridia bacterium]|nr:phage head morphogenesis protein [Clostridia bacterium]